MASAHNVGYGYATGNFTGGGEVSITDTRCLGNTPKAVLLVLRPGQVDDTMTPGISRTVVLFDGTNVYYLRGRAKDAQGSGLNADRWDDGTTNSWLVEDHTGATELGRGTIEMITDGVKLTHTAGTGSIDYSATFFFGADCQAYVGVQALGSAPSWSFDITDPGFQPDLVLTFKPAGTARNSDSPQCAMSIGVATSSGSGGSWLATAGSGVCFARVEDKGNGIPDGGNNHTYIGNMTVGTFAANGFTVSGANNPGGSYLGYLALNLNGSGVTHGAKVHPTATGDDEIPTTFEPGLVFTFPNHGSTLAFTHSTQYASGLGIGTCLKDSNDQSVFHWVYEDGLSTSNTNQISVAGQIISSWDEDALVEWKRASCSLGATSFTNNYSVAKLNPATLYWLALEQGNPQAPPAEGTVWTKQTGAGSSFAKQTGPGSSFAKETGPGSSWNKQTGSGSSWNKQTGPGSSWTEE